MDQRVAVTEEEYLSPYRVFSRDEKKQEYLRLALKNEKLRFYIGDVSDADSLRVP